jgi:hypothetical protein
VATELDRGAESISKSEAQRKKPLIECLAGFRQTFSEGDGLTKFSIQLSLRQLYSKNSSRIIDFASFNVRVNFGEFTAKLVVERRGGLRISNSLLDNVQEATGVHKFQCLNESWATTIRHGRKEQTL